MTKERARANSPSMSRRNMLAGALGTTAAIPATALAYQGGGAETSEPKLPEWWDKLTGPTAETDPEVFYPWQDTPMNRELARKLEDLREFLMFMGVPERVDKITDMRLRWCDGVPQGVHVVGRSGEFGEGLHLYRPEFGWLDRSVKIAGGKANV